MAGAHQAEMRAYQPVDLSGLLNRDKNKRVVPDIPDRFAKYHRDLEELVGVHCSNNCWKSLGGAIGQPTTFDPSRQWVRHVAHIDDGRVEVEVESTRGSHLDNDVVFHLERAHDEWYGQQFLLRK